MIYLHEPKFDKKESKYLYQCIESGWVTTGSFIQKLENKIKNITKSKNVLLCANGTSALQIAFKVVGLNKDHEVLAPGLTFIASINSILYNEAKPIFYDCNNYYVADQEKLINFFKSQTIPKIISYKNKKKKVLINKKTKKIIYAILLVHTFGNASNIDKIYKFLKDHNIFIIEDAAESLGTHYISGRFKNEHTGTIGDIGCLSFNGNKIITSGGGGAILTNTASFYKKAKYLINQAKDNYMLFKHNSVGYNFPLSNLHAAVGYSQSQKFKKILKKKKKINIIYKSELKDALSVKISENPNYASNNCWLNILETKKKIDFKRTINIFKKNNIEIRPFWYPCYRQKYLKKYQKINHDYIDRIYDYRICLPSSYHLTTKEVKKICSVIKLKFDNKNEPN
jgi:perosamine synthetase